MNKHIVWLSFAFTLSCLRLSAAPVLQSTCTMDTDSGERIASTGTNSCVASIPNPYLNSGVSTASASVALVTAEDPTQYSYLALSQSVETRGYPSSDLNRSLPLTGTAYSRVEYAPTLTTVGPVRPGYLILKPEAQGGGYYFSNLDTQVGIPRQLPFTTNSSLTLSCGGVILFQCFPGVPVLSPENPLFQPIAVVLGVPFQMNLVSTASAAGDPGSGYANTFASINISYRFRFVEADDVTPVVTFATPEPKSLGLLSLGLIAGGSLLGLKRARFQSRVEHYESGSSSSCSSVRSL